MPDSILDASNADANFNRILKEAHVIGKEILALYAAEVDRDARFPRESIDALRKAKLLSAAVPTQFEGYGLNVLQIAKICETLGQYCGSTAMIYAMHKIQVACIVHHAYQSSYFRSYLRKLVEEQRLIASATTEVGIDGRAPPIEHLRSRISWRNLPAD